MKRYDLEKKAEIIRLHEEEGRTKASLTEEYNLGENTLSNWITTHRKKFKNKVEETKDKGKELINKEELMDKKEGMMQDLEIKRLKAELVIKEEEIAFLKKAVAFFAKDMK